MNDEECPAIEVVDFRQAIQPSSNLLGFADVKFPCAGLTVLGVLVFDETGSPFGVLRPYVKMPQLAVLQQVGHGILQARRDPQTGKIVKRPVARLEEGMRRGFQTAVIAELRTKFHI